MTTDPFAKTIPFTAQTYQKLQDDLVRLTTDEKDVLVRLQVAREMGDLSENGAYQYAKMELGSIRRQLRQIKHQLSQGFVMAQPSGDTAQLGSKVTVSDGQQQKEFMLVSHYESDPVLKKISIDSPLGMSLLHKKKGDQVTIKAPKGLITYQILAIQQPT